ncbi:hypothetical protein Rumeso_03607 [Rubellimicrobium mesophilum DSM 19309]|uniref:Secreted protein n=1 Tax=Rubellimicrobium mesophilum DSM 19309 TaxID=442562 RepID=A0A017HKI5_9RHOB|nr:hypothetical protein [Rubellimicrobium mesophilum]EYD74840.1 hypothetical protein Rumeso_03607 [Rubellimicrobium mesophilum DSM 19309]
MIELVFVVCLTAAPNTCEHHAMQFMDLTVMACMSGAQPQLAQWVGDHPSWRIQSWSCQPVRLDHDA